MKKLYATLAAVALTASSAFAVDFTVDGFKSLENVTFKGTQLIAPKHNANEVSYLSCIETPKSRVDVPVEFEGNIEDFSILIGYDTNDRQLSMPSNVTVAGTVVTFNNFLLYNGINVVGDIDPEGNITIEAGQKLGEGSLEDGTKVNFVVATADANGYATTTGIITLSMNESGTMLASEDVLAIVICNASTNKIVQIYDAIIQPMMVVPNATVEYSYKGYTDTGVSSTPTTVKQDVWVGFGSSNNKIYCFLTNLVPETDFPQGCVSSFLVYSDAFIAYNPVALPSFGYRTSTTSGLQSGDMMFVNATADGFYTFPAIATPNTISSLSDLTTITFKDWALMNPYTSLDLFGSFIGQEVSDAVVTLKKEETGGVNNVVADPAKAPAQYFNLQGMQLSNPEAGQVVIVKEGNSAKKVIF